MKNLNVLIVDDHKTMLRIVRNLLGQIGITKVEEALDGTAAIDLLKKSKFDLVISDWNMEPMSGLDLVQHVRKDPAIGHQNVPFIMVTAESKPENVMIAMKAGVDNYIVKPFNAETISSKIKMTLAKKAAKAQG